MADSEQSIAIIIVKSIFLIMFIVAAVVGNSSVLHVIRTQKKLNTIPNYFVFNLAVADLAFALTGMPMLLTTAIAKGWILGDFLCNLSGFLNTFFCSASIWTLVMISINRYLAVRKANKFKSIFSRRNTLYAIAFVWLLSFIIAFPPVIGWSEFVAGSNFCTINGKRHVSYSIFVLLMNYFIPFLTLVGLYMSIFLILRKHRKKLGGQNSNSKEANSHQQDYEAIPSENDSSCMKNDITKTNNLPAFSLWNLRDVVDSRGSNESMVRNEVTGSTSLNNETNSEKKKVLKKTNSGAGKLFKEIRITKMLLNVVFGFFLCWTPFLIASILYGLNAVPEELRLLTLGIMFACLNSVINPIIYAVMNRNFRDSFKQLWIKFTRMSGCKSR